MAKFQIKKRFLLIIKKNNFLKFILHWVLYYFVKMLFLTYRTSISYKSSDQKLTPGIFYFWHQNIICGMYFFYHTKQTGYCIASSSKDGKIAGFICEKLGFTVLYGSSHKSPISLIKQSLNVLSTKRQLCLVGDGSRGPAFILQDGVSKLAQKTNLPLVFIECTPSAALTLNKTWDKFKIPLPFSRINIIVHEPFYPIAQQ